MYSTESTKIDTVLTLSRSVYLLEQFQNFNHPKCAIDYLEQKGNEYKLLALYQQLFYEDWNASSACYFSRSSNSRWGQKAAEFLQLIDRRLFPLDLDRDLSAWDESNSLTIPITPMGMGRVEMYQMSYSDLDIGIKLLLPLSQSGRSYLENWGDEETTEILSIWYQENNIELECFDLSKLTHPDNINYKYLHRLCAKSDSPAKILPLALRFIDLDTSNVWLDEPGYDFEADECTQFTFSKSNILFLQREWTKAQGITNAVFSLFDWLEGDDSRFRDILELWQKASINRV